MTMQPLVLRRMLVVAALCGLAAAPAWGQSKTGTALGQFLLIEPSARIAAMGNAGATLYDGGLDAVYYNPAAIGQVKQMSVEFSHSLWLADISFDYAALALPLGNWGNSYVSVTALNSGDIEVRTVDHPLGTGGTYTVSDLAIGLGYGRQITERFAVGGQLSWVQETIWHTSMSAPVFNAGTLYRISAQGLHIGSSISNFGTQGQYAGSDLRILFDADPTRYGDNEALPAEQFAGNFPLPVLFRVGVGYPVRLGERNRLRLALDAFHPSDNTESVSAGAELSVREMLALRAGYQNAFQRDSEVGLTLGAGWKGQLDTHAYRLDYAWADQGRLGSTHRVTFGLTL
jgi:hypothetical protein